MKYFFILLLLIAIFIVSLTLGLSNNQIVTFNYLIAKGDYPISILLAAIFAIGFLLGWLICGVFYAKALILLSNSRRKIKGLETQLAESTQSEHDSEIAVVTNKKR
ncbi:MAG: LapA family protein [Arsenophonus sp. NEOnobi-MAG3]